MAQILQFHVPIDVDTSALEQELVGHGRRVLRDDRLAGHSLNIYTDGSDSDRNLLRQLITAEMARQWVPGEVRFADETGSED